jgi:hypothetical protein
MNEEKVIETKKLRKLSISEMIDETLLLMNQITIKEGRFDITFYLQKEASQSQSPPRNSEIKDKYVWCQENACAYLIFESNIELFGCYENMGVVYQMLLKEDYLEERKSLAFKGFQRIDQLAKSIDSKQAFGAMSFDPSLEKAWQAISEAVQRPFGSVSEDKIIYNTYRVDKDPKDEFIVLKIIGAIRRSKFMVADLTLNRGGVYWEAGFMYGLGRTVIHTMRKSDFDHKDTTTHFNLQQMNLILWEDEADLKQKLSNHIGATIV